MTGRRYWRRLEALLDQISRAGLPALTRAELQELGLLYRQIAADLATVRDDPSSTRTAAALNQLLARAHHTIYSTDRPTARTAFAFFRTTFPRTFRRNASLCLMACVAFALAALSGAWLAHRHPSVTADLLSPAMVQTIEHRKMWTTSIVAIKPLASSTIMTNNINVSFMTFALGITGGVGTAYLLLFNGFLMGVVGNACADAGLSLALWSFVAPHGVLELPAIFIAGGAGLRLAQGLLFPGFLPRRQSLARSGAEAVKLVGGCVPILVVAGVVEAFVSPTDLAVPLKFAVAGALFILLALYLTSARASDRAVRPPDLVAGIPAPASANRATAGRAV